MPFLGFILGLGPKVIGFFSGSKLAREILLVAGIVIAIAIAIFGVWKWGYNYRARYDRSLQLQAELDAEKATVKKERKIFIDAVNRSQKIEAENKALREASQAREEELNERFRKNEQATAEYNRSNKVTSGECLPLGNDDAIDADLLNSLHLKPEAIRDGTGSGSASTLRPGKVPVRSPPIPPVKKRTP